MEDQKSILVRLSEQELARLDLMATATRRSRNSMVLVALDEAFARMNAPQPHVTTDCGENAYNAEG